MLILHSTQCRRKTSQRPRKNPFSAPSHTIWRPCAINRGMIFSQNCIPRALRKHEQNTICFYLLKLPMGRALGRGTMGA